MKDLFITSTLHSDWNLIFNPKLCEALESRNIQCHLPQRDTDQKGSRKDVFQQNIDGIKNSKALLCVVENETVNSGGEVGFAYGINKKIIALKNKSHEIPLMLRYMVDEVVEADDINNIEEYIVELIKKN